MVLLQLKDPVELFVKRREFLSCPRRYITYVVESDVKPHFSFPSFYRGGGIRRDAGCITNTMGDGEHKGSQRPGVTSGLGGRAALLRLRIQNKYDASQTDHRTLVVKGFHRQCVYYQ